MVKKLSKPPLEEVICRFEFTDSCEDLTFYGNLHDKIKEIFPNKSHSTFSDFVFEEIDGKIEPKPIEIKLQKFLNENHDTFIEVGSDVLMVHKIKPYGEWEEFLPILKKAFDAFIRSANLNSLNRIILIYKNRITFDGESLNLDDYFNFRPFFKDELGSAAGPMILGASFPRNENNDLLRITLASKEPPKDKHFFFWLDIEYMSLKPDYVNANNAIDWTIKAHQEIDKAFFNCMSDKLIEEFS